MENTPSSSSNPNDVMLTSLQHSTHQKRELEAKQTLILVDTKDRELGFASREECHAGKGRRHRAVMVFLTKDGDGEVLLQMRDSGKLGGGRWDCSATTHVLKGEAYGSAAERCIKNELGIQSVPRISIVGSFNYTNHYSAQNKSECEHCAVGVGEYSGDVEINQEEASKANYAKITDVLIDVKNSPKKYTKWCRLGIATAFGSRRKTVAGRL